LSEYSHYVFLEPDGVVTASTSRG